VANVADEIDPDAPLGETPLPVAVLEAITVPAAMLLSRSSVGVVHALIQLQPS
jgi:hypothetical protein